MNKLDLNTPLQTISGFPVKHRPDLLVLETTNGAIFVVDEFGRTSRIMKLRAMNVLSEEDTLARRTVSSKAWKAKPPKPTPEVEPEDDWQARIQNRLDGIVGDDQLSVGALMSEAKAPKAAEKWIRAKGPVEVIMRDGSKPGRYINVLANYVWSEKPLTFGRYRVPETSGG